jgi:hypothetical protein
MFDDKQITINYELLSSIKGVGFVVLHQPIYQKGNFIRFDNLSSFLVIVVLSRVFYRKSVLCWLKFISQNTFPIPLSLLRGSFHEKDIRSRF